MHRKNKHIEMIIAFIVSIALIITVSLIAINIIEYKANNDNNAEEQISNDSEPEIVTGEFSGPVKNEIRPSSGDYFQYAIEGSTCWVIPGTDSANNQTIEPNTPYIVKSVDKTSNDINSWRFELDNGAYVSASDTLIDLADLTDEIIYDISYSYSSRLMIHSMNIPGVTGEQMPGYNGAYESDRFGGDIRFRCPVYWQTACMLQNASDKALESGYRLVIYDAYRPYSASVHMYEQVADFVYSNDISFGSSWSTGWFVASGVSSHNTGCAVDAFLIDSDDDYTVDVSQECSIACDPIYYDGKIEESDYPTPIDECSEWSTYLTSPNGTVSDKINESTSATMLHDVMTSSGFDQLDSEWWHYDNNAGDDYVMSATANNGLDFSF